MLRAKMLGKRFGRLKVIRLDRIVYYRTKSRQTKPYFLARCDCGNELAVAGQSLRRGATKSCGCLRRENGKFAFRHGDATRRSGITPEYRAWQQMRRRCGNRRSKDWKAYGGRGIKVCKRWLRSYKSFLADMGRKPSSKHSLDRYPDNDGDYKPSNCRWATPSQQANNRRRK